MNCWTEYYTKHYTEGNKIKTYNGIKYFDFTNKFWPLC